jgi:hypothetical protein
LQVTLNGKVISNNIALAAIDQINVQGQDGNDAITIANIPKPINVDGGAGTNSLTVNGKATTANAFSLATDLLTVNGAVYDLVNLNTLTVNGGSAADAFAVAALPSFATAAGAVVFNGAAGADRVTGPNSANSWNITAANAGTLTTGGRALKFTGMENLTGGTAADTLSYAAQTKAISVNLQTHKATVPSTGVVLTGSFTSFESFVGGTAKDTLVGANQANTWEINDANAGTVDGESFSSFENLTGGTLADIFSIQTGGSLTGKLAGGVGANALTGPDQGNTWSITAKNAGNLNGTAFGAIQNLTGGSGNDNFVLANGVGVGGKIDGGGGVNALDYSKYTTFVKVNLATGSTTNIFAGAAGGLSNIQIVLGGSAGSTLAGGNNGDVLVGGSGKDTLTGGSGRNILIGGAGADKLTGGADEDLLISGTTSFSKNLAALDALFGYWLGSDVFATRVANLHTGIISGVPAFNSTNITNDVAADTLAGGASLDWFFAKLTNPAADPIADLDLAGGEVVN